MFSIWFTGFILFILFRVFYAGMNYKSLFYRGPKYSFEDPGLYYDDNKTFGYSLWTFVIGITWLISVPAYGVFLLGKRFAKES